MLDCPDEDEAVTIRKGLRLMQIIGHPLLQEPTLCEESLAMIEEVKEQRIWFMQIQKIRRIRHKEDPTAFVNRPEHRAGSEDLLNKMNGTINHFGDMLLKRVVALGADPAEAELWTNQQRLDFFKGRQHETES